MTSASKSPETAREEAANVLLTQMLRDHGMEARAERRSSQGTPDVRVRLGTGDRVILEGKWEASSSLLEGQLDDRLRDFPNALGVIGLLYPNRLRYEDDLFAHLESASDLQWWIHGSRGEVRSERPMRTGSVADLVDHLRVLSVDIEGEDLVDAAARAVGHGVEQAAQQIADHARVSRRISDLIAESDQEKERAAALRIGCLVLFNALAFQDRLSEVNEDVETAPEAWGKGLKGLRDAWRYICENIDYIPVFELAVNILDVLDAGRPEVQEPVIEPLLAAVKRTRHLEGHDLSGRLFHTLLTDAKFTGAYYTSVPAATMLARLVFHDWPPHVDWKDHEFPASLNVADLACGTGTLLMAVASEAERRHKSAGGRHAAELHKAMVEQALHGYDVQLTAVHFAATSLAMLNPSIQFDRMNLYVMALGAEGSNVSLGSLDFMGGDEVAVQFALSPDSMGVNARQIRETGRVYGGGSQGARQGVTATLPDIDLAIMNPPFTRSIGGNLMFGGLPSSDRRKLQNELSRRLKSRQASATAGLGAAFVATAAPKLRPGEGRLALVLPLTVCTGPSWEQTRALIERDFVLDMVIASHDPTRWNFSDSTDLSEALLIATRRPTNGPETEHRTTFVNLWLNPDGIVDAHRIAEAAATTTAANIEDTGTALLEVDGRHVGEVLSIPESKLTGRKWAGVQFARADVTRSALRLLDDDEVWVPGESKSVSIPLCRLDDLGQIGPDVRDVRDGFEPIDSVTAYPMVSGHNTEQRRRLVAEPDKYLSPLSQPRPRRNLKRVDQLWPKAGQLLISERLWLNTTRVVSMSTDKPVLSNVWWPVKTGNHSWDKALSVYLNSSIGLLTLLGTRNTTRGGWVKLKKVDLNETPVLDPRRLSSSQLQRLSDLFDALSEEEFERLPGMAHCPTRKRLDDGVSEILGLPDLSTLRDLLASEPVVSNTRL
ncbi:MAG: hypothetical protein F4W93_01585 [Dehalococcoidia bacterium]|nr:hypothetical protein [Dehalococcoidia bacterium]